MKSDPGTQLYVVRDDVFYIYIHVSRTENNNITRCTCIIFKPKNKE